MQSVSAFRWHRFTFTVLPAVIAAGLGAAAIQAQMPPPNPGGGGKSQFAPNDTSPEAIVTRAYRDILGRDPDAAGMRTYRSHIIDDDWDENDVRKDIRRQAETKTTDADAIIRRAYQDVLGRDPDKSGLETYRRMIAQEGWSEKDVRNDLRKSGETKGADADQIVRRAYQDILGRAPDKAGLEMFKKKIAEDGWSEKKVREALKESAEYKNRK